MSEEIAMLKMTMLKKICFLLATVVICCLPSPAAPVQDPVGRSSTLLPDGRVLLAGGYDSRSVPTADVLVGSTGLPTGMNIARAGHTATVLPDGTVLIFGGIGADGKLVAAAERFDPATQAFTTLPGVLALPRAFHTATLLTNGLVLFAGGVTAGGAFPDDIQLYDYRSKRALSHHALLATPRQGQTASLLADGSVRLSGGTDRFGRPIVTDEIFDPVSKKFRSANTADTDMADSNLPFAIAASIPSDGASDVPLQDPIAIRFNRLLNVATATGQNFVLTGPDQSVVGAKVTAAEAGRLVFVLPNAPLQPGTHYVLRITNAKTKTGDEGAAEDVLPETIIAFDTEGAPPDGPGLDWVPNSTWTDPNGIARFQQLPPLQAPSGTTALAGQVLRLSGWPLRHVTLEIDGGPKTQTDSTGRFLLRGLTPGHHVMWIDASTANHDDSVYGVYEVGVNIVANKTNVLKYTVWMTRLDMAHAVTIPSPTLEEMVLTNPAMPGLELHLPAGTTIKDRSGKVVHQVSITPVPLNKPPFPLPAGVEVPIYFTVQPGGAYISVQSSGQGPKGARLTYPNAFHFQAGTPFDFWNYDANAKGWFVYGHGKVGADGSNVIPDPGVVIYEFTGAMVGGPDDAPGIGTPAGRPKAKAADPVDLSTGLFRYSKTDLALPDLLPLTLTRSYISNDRMSRAFGIGSTHNFDVFMVGNTNPYSYQELILPDGGRVHFNRISPGTGYTDAIYVHASSGSAFYGAYLSPNTDPSIPGFWKIVLKDGTIYSFPDSQGSTRPSCQALVGIQDRYGNRISFSRDANCRLTRITSPNGRYIAFTNDALGRITQATDNSGRSVTYAYDTAGHLSTVTDPGNGVTTYTYDDQNRMLTITDPRNITYLTNEYDEFGRVSQQTQADTGTYVFNWTSTQNATQAHFENQAVNDACFSRYSLSRYDLSCVEGYLPLIQQVDVTDPRGYVRRVVFGPTGYMTSDTHALGQPEQQTTTYSYYSDNLLKSVTDALGRVTSFDYDSQGNTTRVTRLEGTANAVTTTFSYQGPFGQLTSITDPLNHTSTFGYDQHGNRSSATDALNHQTTFSYGNAGELLSLTDSANQTAQFGYFGGDLVSKTDPLGHVATEFRDPLGRITKFADALGQTTSLQYDGLNRIQQVTDPRGQISTYSYDGNGNPLSLTDANQHSTTYTYDAMDRRASRTDALLRTENLAYDLNGNISTVTDRKGQVTAFTYDGLNRVTNVCFNRVVNGGVTSCETTVGYQYDLVNRRTIVTDSVSGVITRTYDDLGRLANETNPQGSVSYAYDAGSRLTSKTVAGQAPFTYNYDIISHLTSITQGTKSVQFTYDSAGRPTTLTMPSGLAAAYTYDGGSRLTGISYSANQVSIGNLTYTYDALNRRIGVGGSLAAVGLPPALTSATYDVANQIASWNGTAVSYDANGNMLSDGSNNFSWDARGHLASITGALTASFGYDALGRRIAKSVGPYALGYVYDGGGITQELSGGTVTANVWSGGSNGFLERTDSAGTVDPLTDALGNVIGLADSNGNLVSQYLYDPFGGTTATGAPSGNPFQYIGRENDLTGLYYMHARYYSPALMRFISEDPLGFAGGDVNLHAYTGNSPSNFRDPSGTSDSVQDCAIGAVVNVGLNLLTDYITARKSTIGDAFSVATLRYGAEGCEGGIVGGIVGEYVLAPLAKAATSYVADFFTSEAVAAEVTAVAEQEGIAVTQEGLEAIETHLESLDALDYKPNQAMLDSLRSTMESGGNATGAYENFYQHELEEAAGMAKGLSYDTAHQMALEGLEHSPFSIYSREVVEQFPQLFNHNWRAFWGLP